MPLDPKGRHVIAPPVRAGITNQRTMMRREGPTLLSQTSVALSALRKNRHVKSHALTGMAITFRLFEAHQIGVTRYGRSNVSRAIRGHCTNRLPKITAHHSCR